MWKYDLSPDSPLVLEHALTTSVTAMRPAHCRPEARESVAVRKTMTQEGTDHDPDSPGRQDEAELQEGALVEARLRSIQEGCQSLYSGAQKGRGTGC